MMEILDMWKSLVEATERKGAKLNEAAAQQQFNRGIEDIEIWLSEVEGQLLSEDYGKVSLLHVCFKMIILLITNLSVYFIKLKVKFLIKKSYQSDSVNLLKIKSNMIQDLINLSSGGGSLHHSGGSFFTQGRI